MSNVNSFLSRRHLIIGGSLAATAAAHIHAADDRKRQVSKDFLWGVSTSAHQSEGSNLNSDLWVLEQLPVKLFSEPSLDASDSYHRYAEDILLFAQLGFNAWRFSVEWARVEPMKGFYSRAELDHYKRIAAMCRDNGIAPLITLHHFTSPVWLAADGGWEQASSADLFARYCKRVAEHLEDLPAVYSTINEINVPPQIERANFLDAAKRAAIAKTARDRTGAPNFSTMFTGDPKSVGQNFIHAHSQARDAIKSARPKCSVGMTLAIRDHQAAEGGEARLKAIQATDYDPYFELAKQDDYIGVQSYTRTLVGPEGERKPAADVAKTGSESEYYPQALEHCIRYAAAGTGKPVYVTENGIPIDDDNQRIAYTREALQGMVRCIADGVDVRGYCHWSALDNYEWMYGYKHRYGLIAVDPATFARTPKGSAKFLGDVARRGRL